ASQGKYIPVSVAAHQKSGVKRIGWLVGGVAGQTAKTADSLVQGSPPFPDTLNFVDSVLVTGSTGFFTIAGFAVDSGNRVGQTSPITVTILSVANDNTPPQIEQFLTLRPEANATMTLPFGGRIVDAIYSANQRELYLTNPSLSRVEIFQAANSTFVTAGIPTAGPQPWGIALWPRDTLGAYGDSIVVANSGGTQLSIIDVSPARVLRWRQDLPDFLIQTYKVVSVSGGFKVEITEYNISDRPQYLGTVCRPAGGTACSLDSVFALYSTTPEPSNPAPFTGRATLRMEKLFNPGNPPDTSKLFGHVFWEISNAPPSATSGIRGSGQVDVDLGMSPSVAVNDFISNTATKIRSIATNFNGRTNAARADSVYYLDEGLRLKATSPDSGIATGMDMNYNHN